MSELQRAKFPQLTEPLETLVKDSKALQQNCKQNAELLEGSYWCSEDGVWKFQGLRQV